MGLTIGIISGLVAMAGFGLSNGIAKAPSMKLGSKRTVFYRNMLTTAILLGVLAFYHQDARFIPLYLGIAAGISLLAYIPLLTYYKALKLGDVGVVSPIANSSVIFTILLSMIFFSEKISFLQFVAIGIIVCGIILESLNLSDLKGSHIFKWSTGRPYAVITCLLWGVVFFLFKIPVNALGPILTSLIIEGGIFLWSGADLKLSGTKLGLGKDEKRFLWQLLMVAISGACGILFFNIGIARFGVSIVAALTFASPIVTTLYGWIAYNERLSVRQYISIAAIIAGVMMIYYF